MVLLFTQDATGVHYAATIQSLAAVVSAAASVGLLFVVIRFGQDVRASRLRPTLRLLFDASTPDLLAFGEAPHTDYWVRLRVRNDAGKDIARGVQLLLLQVRRPLHDGPSEFPSRPFQLSDEHVVELDLPSNLERRFDVLNVRRDVYEYSGPMVRLTLLPPSRSTRSILPVGEYTLVLALIADNTDASYWELPVRVTAEVTQQADFTEIVRVGSVSRLQHRPSGL